MFRGLKLLATRIYPMKSCSRTQAVIGQSLEPNKCKNKIEGLSRSSADCTLLSNLSDRLVEWTLLHGNLICFLKTKLLVADHGKRRGGNKLGTNLETEIDQREADVVTLALPTFVCKQIILGQK